MGKIHKLYFEKQNDGYEILDFTGTSIDKSCEIFFGKMSEGDKRFILELSDESFNGAYALYFMEEKLIDSNVHALYFGVNPTQDNISEIRMSKYFKDIFGSFPQKIYYRKFFNVR